MTIGGHLFPVDSLVHQQSPSHVSRSTENHHTPPGHQFFHEIQATTSRCGLESGPCLALSFRAVSSRVGGCSGAPTEPCLALQWCLCGSSNRCFFGASGTLNGSRTNLF